MNIKNFSDFFIEAITSIKKKNDKYFFSLYPIHLQISFQKKKNSKASVEIVLTNKRIVETILTKLLEKITSQKNIESMPQSIKTLCFKISNLAKKYHPETEENMILVGGLVMLRLFNPYITSPLTFDVVPESTVITPTAQKNLILISRIIQHLSNNLFFLKPPYDIFDPWLKKKEDQMRKYFRSLIECSEGNIEKLSKEKKNQSKKKKL